MLAGGHIDGALLTFCLMSLGWLFIESIMFSVTLLASGIGWDWLIGMNGGGGRDRSVSGLYQPA
jgi:hypothetical protein